MESNTSNNTQEKDVQQTIKTTLLLKPDDSSLSDVANDQKLSIKTNNSICSKQKRIKKPNLFTSSPINEKIVGERTQDNLAAPEAKASSSTSTEVEASCTAKTSKKLNRKFNKLQKKISSLIASNLMETPPLPIISFKTDATAIKSIHQDEKHTNNKISKPNQQDNNLDDDEDEEDDDDDELSEVLLIV
jgi:hypothetical protein